MSELRGQKTKINISVNSTDCHYLASFTWLGGFLLLGSECVLAGGGGTVFGFGSGFWGFWLLGLLIGFYVCG